MVWAKFTTSLDTAAEQEVKRESKAAESSVKTACASRPGGICCAQASFPRAAWPVELWEGEREEGHSEHKS